MFGAMMTAIAEDFVKYVMHVQVVVEQPAPQPDVRNVQYSAPDDPVQGARRHGRRRRPRPGRGEVGDAELAGAARPTRRSRRRRSSSPSRRRLGRNEPCPCGSGKKFKLCHGR